MTKKYLLIILALSFASHFAFFSVPAETVFDEVHFGKFVSGYFKGEYFFDIHPPLGKLLIIGAAKISGFQPGFSFETIGQKFTDEAYKWLRFLPKLAGSLLPAVIFLIALELLVEVPTFSRGSSSLWLGSSAPSASLRRGSGTAVGISQKFAFLAGLLSVFENSLLVQSRFILLDSFLLLFGFLGILFYLKAKTYYLKPIWLFLAGFFAILAASVKWTGLSFLAIIIIFYILETFKYEATMGSRPWCPSSLRRNPPKHPPSPRLRRVRTSHSSMGLRPWSSAKADKPRGLWLKFFLKGLFLLVVVPSLIYFSIFAIHFALLDKPGPGNAFHPPNFQQMNVFEKFIELNSEIYQSNARLTATHPYTSQWYEWPFMTRPIYYWNSSTNSSQAGERIYLLGNPLIYWLSTIAVIYFLIPFKLNFKFIWIKNPTCLFLLTAYFLNLLPFIFIGRVMFLYHYSTSLIFAILILVYLLNELPEKNQKTVFNSVLIGSIILFFFFSPLTYGLKIPEQYYDLLVWLPTWK